MSRREERVSDEKLAALQDCYHRGTTTRSLLVVGPNEDEVSAYTVRDIAAELTTARQEIAALTRERDGWNETAREMANGLEFYRGIVQQAGAHLGPEVYTSDDGSVQDSVLALKVPELVATLRAQHREAVEAVAKAVALLGPVEQTDMEAMQRAITQAYFILRPLTPASPDTAPVGEGS